MARRFTKVSEVEIVAINETAFFYLSDLVNTKTTIPLRIGQLVGNYLSGVDTGFFLIRGVHHKEMTSTWSHVFFFSAEYYLF